MTLAEFINKVGFKVNQEDVKKVNDTISSIKSTATKALGLLGIGISLSQLNAIAEEFNGINDKLNYALEYSEDMKDVQKEILAGANRCHVAYSNMVDTVVSLKQANAEVFPINEAATFVEYLNKLGKSAGYSDGEISSMQSSIQRVVAAGVMSTSDVIRMARQTPALVEKLCDGLGVTREQLDAMAEAGQITAATLKQAIMGSADSIDASFDRLDYSISDAMLNIRNQWGYFVDDLNASTGLSQTIAKTMVSAFTSFMGVLNRVRNGIVWLTDKLGGMGNVLKIIGIAIIGLNLGKVTSIATKLLNLVTTIHAKTVAFVAVFILLALLIEDFISFIQGNDSLFGTLLERAEVDCDALREDVVTAWENISQALRGIWEGIKNVVVPIFKFIGDFIGETLSKLAPEVAEFIEKIANGDVDTEQWVKVGENIAKIAIAIFSAISAARAVTATIKGVKTAIDATKTAVKGITKAVSFLKSPIGLVTVAIAAVIAIVVLCILYWDKIKAAFIKAWEAIKSAWNSVVDFFQGVWDGIVSVFWGVVSWFSNLFSRAWEGIKKAFGAVGEFFRGIWDGIVQIFSGVIDWFAGIFSAAWEAIKGVFATVGEFFQGVWDTIVELFTSIGTAVSDAVSGAVKGAINAVLSGAIGIINGFISAINAAISVINAIPGVEIKKLTKLEVPQLAEGGIATKATGAVIGEGKEPEAVLPLSKLGNMIGGYIRKAQESGAGQVLGKLVSVAKAFTGSSKPTPSTVNSVTNSSSVNRSVVQNVNINNKFEGDRAIQKDASRAMDKSAKDVTSELARGLAFAK